MGAEIVGALNISEEGCALAGAVAKIRQRQSTNQANHLDTTLIKLILQFRKSSQLGRADGGKVGRVGEEDGPAVTDELMEVNLALGG